MSAKVIHCFPFAQVYNSHEIVGLFNFYYNYLVKVPLFSFLFCVIEFHFADLQFPIDYPQWEFKGVKMCVTQKHI